MDEELNIDLDELGVPESIAKNLTYPEIVNNYNIWVLNLCNVINISQK